MAEQEQDLIFSYINDEDRGGSKTPMKGTSLAAGYDLCAYKSATVPARGQALIATNLMFEIPPGTYGRVVKNCIGVNAGVIDADYRGEVKVLLLNFGDTDFTISPGDRIAQLIIEKIQPTKLVRKERGELTSTQRAAGGFGSTGVN